MVAIPHQLTLADLRNVRPVFLLDLDWGGTTYRVSTEPIPISYNDGVYSYEGGLEDPEMTQQVDRFELATSGSSAQLEIYLREDVPHEVAKGRDLSAATAELSMVLVEDRTANQVWEDRIRLLSGRVVSPEWGDPEEPDGWVSFTLEQQAYDDVRTLIPLDARVTDTTWPSGKSDTSGKVYPYVFGTPGKFTDESGGSGTTNGSPAYVVEETVGSADTLLIAGHTVEASSVTIYDGSNVETFTVAQQNDGLGRTCTVVDVSGAGTISRTASEYWVQWTHSSGGGMQNPFGTGELEGAGDVIRWALSQSSVAVDHGRWGAVAGYLNRVRLAGYVNDPEATPWEWIADNVLPLLPVSVVTGPDGLTPIIHAHDLREAHVTTPITEGGEWSRISPARQEGTWSDVRNEFRISFAGNAASGDYLRSILLTPDRDSDDPEQTTNYYAQASKSRYGLAAEMFSTDIVYDDVSAMQAIAWRSVTQGFLPTFVAYNGAIMWGWLEVGDTISLTDADLHLTDIVATIVSKTWTGDSWDFEVMIDDNVLRSSRAT